MAVDGEIDYRAYTDAQLDEALGSIDRSAYPQNYANLLAELAARAERAAAPHRPAALGQPRLLQPEFRGEGGEYFRIWIVNLALTILTVGIYSAWAKVRKLRYFHGSTVLEGSAFGYHAQPLQILKGRAIAALFVAAYFVASQVSPVGAAIAAVALWLATPWLLVKSRVFSMRVTSWRGLRFDFHPNYEGAYKIYVGLGLLAGVTLGLAIPYFIRERYRFVANNTIFCGEHFRAEPRVGRFYKTAFVAVGISVALLLALALVAGGTLALTGVGRGEDPNGIGPLLAGAAFYVVLFPVVGGYVLARNLNEVWSTTTLGPHALQSTLSARKLIWIYFTNLVGIVCTLGLYTPWAQIRLAEYRVSTVQVLAAGSLDDFVARETPVAPGAAGEEAGDLFDVDFGL